LLLIATVLVPPAAAAPSPPPCCAALAAVGDEFQRVAVLADRAARGDDASSREGIAALASLPSLLESTASCAGKDDPLVVLTIDEARQLVDVLDRTAGLLARRDPWPNYREAHATATAALRDAREALAAARVTRAHSDPSAAAAALDRIDAQLVTLDGGLQSLADTDPMVSTQSSFRVQATLEELRQAGALLDAYAGPGAAQATAQTPPVDVDRLAAAFERLLDSAVAVVSRTSAWTSTATMLRQSTMVARLDLDGTHSGVCTGL
jgi:hypothetical protein